MADIFVPLSQDEWVARELAKLLPTITEESWDEVWTVIDPKAS